MDKLLNVAVAIIPVLITLLIGYIIKQKNIISLNGIGAIKLLVLNITLPAVLFNAYLTIDYDVNAGIIAVTMYAICALALAVGYFINKLLKHKNKYLPYILTTFEVGMLGYVLYTLLFGAEHINNMAIVDLGQVTFVFTVYMSILKQKNGGETGVKSALLGMIKSPVFIAIMTGVILGVTGINQVINSSDAGKLLTNTVAFLGAPTSAAILIVVGYELNLSGKNLKQALTASAFRLLIMAVLCVSVVALLSLIMPIRQYLLWGIILVFAMPPVYVLPIFVKDQRENEFISTTISIYTLITILLFMIAAFIVA